MTHRCGNASAEMGNHRSEELDRTWEAEMRHGTKEKGKKNKRKEKKKGREDKKCRMMTQKVRKSHMAHGRCEKIKKLKEGASECVKKPL